MVVEIVRQKKVPPYMRLNNYHLLDDIDTQNKTATCTVCGPSIPIRARSDRGRKSWRCLSVARTQTDSRLKRPYTVHKGEVCEWCGFVPRISEQLDIDHKDGNHFNNNPANLQTLCANCHRLKNYAQRKRRLIVEFGYMPW